MADNVIKEQEVVTLRTYAKAWKFDTIIYSMGDITLPFAVNITQAGFFAIAVGIVLILTVLIPPLANVNFIIKFIVVPFLGMKAATSIKLEGKPPHKWIVGFFRYLLFQPKMLSRFKRCEKTTGFRFETQDIYGKIKGDVK